VQIPRTSAAFCRFKQGWVYLVLVLAILSVFRLKGAVGGGSIAVERIRPDQASKLAVRKAANAAERACWCSRIVLLVSVADTAKVFTGSAGIKLVIGLAPSGPQQALGISSLQRHPQPAVRVAYQTGADVRARSIGSTPELNSSLRRMPPK